MADIENEVPDFGTDLLTLQDENGVEHNFEVLDAIETDDARYMALCPVFDDPEQQVESDGDLMIFEVVEDEDGEMLQAIEDDAKFEEIAAIFEERLSEMYDFSDEND